MYFAGRYDRPRYVDLRLQLLLQAVASYAGVTATRPAPDPSHRWGLVEPFPVGYEGPANAFDLAVTNPVLEASIALAHLRPVYALVFSDDAEGHWDKFRAAVLNTLAYILLGNQPSPTRRTGAGTTCWPKPWACSSR